LYFRGPNSFTGEDIVELHTHGSRAIINLILKRLGEIEGFFMAEPGEFTRRAFLHGKLDLVQTEGLLSVIHSETQEQLFQANKQLSGETSKVFDLMRSKILQIFSNCEALLDFPEDDIYDGNTSNFEFKKRKITVIENNIFNQMIEIREEVFRYLDDGFIGEKIANGFKIAIVGEPNVGKSSLINYLAKKPIAIVSDVAGTTRDLVTVNLNISGYQVELTDTAGIRETDDLVESIGVSRARFAIEDADLVLILSTIQNPSSYQGFIEKFDDKKHFLILNKMDDYNDKNFAFDGMNYIPISIQNDKNLDVLFEKIKHFLLSNASSLSPIITTRRQRTILENLYLKLRTIIEEFNDYQFLDILTEDIRDLAEHISQLTGTIITDDILNELFCNFCIGK
jgi:tRNA modification GTPase